MTFIFDENLSPRMVQALALLDLGVLSIAVEYGRGTPDEEWIPKIAQRGLIYVGCDEKLRSEPMQRLALERNHVTAVFMFKRFLDQGFHKQALWFLRHWENMEAAVEGSHSGTMFRATSAGSVKRMP